ncbi:reverse transcriptase N-terminal domain-containing protein [Planctomycetota bacterium]
MYDWNTINWRKLEQSVFKLQKRIYQPTCREDVKTVQPKNGSSYMSTVESSTLK